MKQIPEARKKSLIIFLIMKSKWIIHGLFWGVFMFFMMGIAIPLAEGQPLTFKTLIIKFVAWMIGGLIYGFVIQKIEGRGKVK